MKLRELVEQLNEGLKVIQGEKYDGMNQYRSTIDCIVNPILRDTELGKLLVNGVGIIRLVTEEDINCCGAGEEVITITIDKKEDKRIKYGCKGSFISAKAEAHQNLDNNLLDFELIELQPYFNEKNLKSNIKWYDSEIGRLKKEILDLEHEKSICQDQLNNIN